jgi:hypothetical protein
VKLPTLKTLIRPTLKCSQPKIVTNIQYQFLKFKFCLKVMLNITSVFLTQITRSPYSFSCSETYVVHAQILPTYPGVQHIKSIFCFWVILDTHFCYFFRPQLFPVFSSFLFLNRSTGKFEARRTSSKGRTLFNITLHLVP